MASPNSKAPLGQGGRFAALKAELGRRTGKRKVRNPGALARYIGEKKYGKARFSRLAARGRKSA